MMRSSLRASLAATVFAASAASAWAAYQSSLIPNLAPRARAAPSSPAPLAASRMEPVDLESPVDRDESAAVVGVPRVARPGAPKAPVPRSTSEAREPRIEVTRPRLTRDQRLQGDVIEALARNTSFSGRIGVVSEKAVVTLTGYTLTPGQADRAGRTARGIEGVRGVVNHIRPRIGGSP